MVRLLIDEDIDLRIVRGLRRRLPSADLLTVRELGLAGHHDRDILTVAAIDDRIVLTHDVTSMTAFALERVVDGRLMPGVFAAHQDAAIGAIIDDLVLLISASAEDEWTNQIKYLPL